MNRTRIKGAIEAILFISNGPVTAAAVAKALGMEQAAAKQAIGELAEDLRANERGTLVFELDGAYQLCTNPAYHEQAAMLTESEEKPLTMPLLETLAIVACKQPVCKADIENIRGVDATHAVNKLLEYELIVETGRSRAPGRPILFATSRKFLAHFGLSDASLLNTFEEAESEDS